MAYPRARHTIGFRLVVRICLHDATPSAFTRDFRHPGLPCSLRPHIAHEDGSGILTGSVIGIGLRLSLSARLTLIRLALIRNPWSFGGGASRPPYRYSFLHLLFRTLQFCSRRTFAATGMLPYHKSAASADSLMPAYYPCSVARLVSCYALFE